MSTSPPEITAALIVAAGRGLRAGGGIPKQWRDLGGMSVAERTLRAFASHRRIDRLVLVLHPDDVECGFVPADPPAEIVTGGASPARTLSDRPRVPRHRST